MPVQIVEFLAYDFAAVHGRSAGKVPLTHHFGLDSEAKFQRLASGSRRALSTVGGPVSEMKFVITGTANCKIVSQDMTVKGLGGRNGMVVIEGVSPGTGTKVELKDGAGKTVDAIDVQVGKFVGIKVRFYNLIDGKGRKAVSTIPFAPVPPMFSEAKLDTLVDRVNDIVNPQCDCLLAVKGKGAMIDLATPNDLGDRVDINKFNIFSFGDMDKDAQYHVVFVWSIDGPHTNGITRSNVTLLEASLSEEKRDLTLAHEFVHFLSGGGVVTIGDHDERQSDLMFKTAPHGINMRKLRLQKILVGQGVP